MDFKQLMKTRQKGWRQRGLITSCAFAVLAAMASAGDVAAAPCTNMLTPSETTPRGFGSAYNRLTPSKEFLIHGTECDGQTAQVSIGGGAPEQFIYKNGFRWTGSDWQEIPLSGSTLVSDTWFKGKATGSVPLGTSPNYLLGYVCQRDEEQWKCGCSDADCSVSQWQIQALADAADGGGDDDSVTPDSCLAPPRLSNPMVVDGDACPNVVDGKNGDLLIKMPKKVCTKPLLVRNARNVHVLGGRIELDTADARAVSFSNIKNTAHVEGMHIDVQNRFADGIRIYKSPQAILTVQNSLIEGLGGTPRGAHGDVIHIQGDGPLATFQVENLTGLTSYQGIFTPYRLPKHGSTGAERVELTNVDLGYDPRMPQAQKPLMLLTMGTGNPKPNKYNMLDYSAPKGTKLTNVFIDGSERDVAYHTKVLARPNPGSDGCATFDAVHKIDGKVCNGLPKTGHFAPRNAVGANYARAKFCTN